MDVWAWIVVYAVGLTLLQLLVYRYLINSGGSLTRRVGSPFGDSDRDSSWREQPSGSDVSSDAPGLSSASSRVETDGDGGSASRSPSASDRARANTPRPSTVTTGRPCPHCGAANEPDATFSRCWNCAGSL